MSSKSSSSASFTLWLYRVLGGKIISDRYSLYKLITAYRVDVTLFVRRWFDRGKENIERGERLLGELHRPRYRYTSLLRVISSSPITLAIACEHWERTGLPDRSLSDVYDKDGGLVEWWVDVAMMEHILYPLWLGEPYLGGDMLAFYREIAKYYGDTKPIKKKTILTIANEYRPISSDLLMKEIDSSALLLPIDKDNYAWTHIDIADRLMGIPEMLYLAYRVSKNLSRVCPETLE